MKFRFSEQLKVNFRSSERQRCLHQFGRIVTKIMDRMDISLNH